MSRAIITA